MGSGLAEPGILVAPDSFKGTMRAAEVAAAVCDGIESAGRAAQSCPLADGGEGTIEALIAGTDFELVGVTVAGPLGEPIEAEFALVDGGSVAIVETAKAIGLQLVPPDRRDPEVTTTVGAGELIAAAIDSGAAEVLVALGGSSTVDGGRGALEALAAKGYGASNARGPALTALCDARTPWEDAARTFGPQKGADPAAVRRLTAVMLEQVKGLRRDPTGLNFTGAAGGLGGALWSELGAELVAGAQFMMVRIGFDARMKASRALVVGEGRMDSTTLLGKAPGEAATRARQAGIPCAAVCGENALDPMEERIIDLQLVVEAGDPASLREAGRLLAKAM